MFTFCVYIFGSFRNKANVNIQYYLVLTSIPLTPLTLNDCKWPFDTCDCEDFAHFADKKYCCLLRHIPLYYQVNMVQQTQACCLNV